MEAERWTLKGGGSWKGQLQYQQEEGGWFTRLQRNLSAKGWTIEARGEGPPGQRSGDPILDSQVRIEAPSTAQLERIVRQEGATQVLLSAICGQGLRLEKQRLEFVTEGLVVEPLDMLQDAVDLEALLQA
jgi:hypothetical protein